LPPGKHSPEIDCVIRKIRDTIAHSPVPEDPLHAENTLIWVLRIAPQAGESLKIAALGHDIERAERDRRVRREDFPTYDAYKEAHAARSAELLREIMETCGADSSLTREVVDLVRKHETGGTPEADILREADSLSFFDTNITLFYEREGRDTTKERILWGLKRLSESSLRFLYEMKFEPPELEILVRSCINKALINRRTN